MQATDTHVKKRKRKRWLLFFLVPVFLGAAVLGALWYWNTHKKEIIRKKIENAIRDKTDGLYKISYDSIEINELAGNLSFFNLHLVYDSAKYQVTEQNKTAPPLLFTVDVPEIKIMGVKTGRAVNHNEFVGKKLEIREPVITIYYTNQGKDSLRSVPTMEVYEQVFGNLKLLEVDTVVIAGALIKTRSRKTGKQIVQGSGIDISLFHIKIDSSSFADTSRLLFAREISLSAGNINWASSNNLYHYTVENIALHSATKKLEIGAVAVQPSLGEDAFVNALPYQDDRFNFSFRAIQFINVDTRRLLDENLQAAEMIIAAASFKIYRDLARPRDHKNRVGLYPHQVLDDIPFIFDIKKVTANDSYIEYKERNHITRQSGRVRFHHVNAVLWNFTNDKKAAGKEMTATITSSFLDQTPFSTKWKFYLFHPRGKFDVSGEVGPMDAKLLNPLTEPMGPASIREGNLKGAEFNLHGDDYRMEGTVEVLYDNLKVDLLEMDKGAVKPDKKFLTSLLANIIIKNSNPKKNEEPRVASVDMTRDINHSIFYLCWKTIFKGIRETVGIKKDVAPQATNQRRTSTRGK